MLLLSSSFKNTLCLVKGAVLFVLFHGFCPVLADMMAGKVINPVQDNLSEVLGSFPNSLVVFKTTWCGHCKTLEEPSQKVVRAFQDEIDFRMIHVDCDKYPKICAEYDIKGYPTIKICSSNTTSDSPSCEDYMGMRNAESMVKSINKKFGYCRDVNGDFDKTYGRTAELDQLAHGFLQASNETQAQTIKKLKDLSVQQQQQPSEFSPSSISVYLDLMEKTLSQGPDYIKKDCARISSILEKKTCGLHARYRFVRRINIAKVFLGEASPLEQPAAESGDSTQAKPEL